MPNADYSERSSPSNVNVSSRTHGVMYHSAKTMFSDPLPSVCAAHIRGQVDALA